MPVEKRSVVAFTSLGTTAKAVQDAMSPGGPLEHMEFKAFIVKDDESVQKGLKNGFPEDKIYK